MATSHTQQVSGAARSALFVPASRPERIPKALASGADVIIVDLEDAVEANAKDTARDALAAFLDGNPEAGILVRINGVGTPEHDADLAMCNARSGVAGIMLPKTESAAHVQAVAAGGKPVWPIVETAAAMLALGEITRASGIARIAFGSLDFGLDLGLNQNSEAALALLDHARCQILLHSRAAGLAAPLDGVHAAISDTDGLQRYAQRARDLGFGGMLCIHPSQVAAVHAAFAVSEKELAWARSVVQEAERTGLAAFRLDGEMVDAPVIGRAREILARAA
nr:CoA ester lyase [Pseudomonas sp.]